MKISVSQMILLICMLVPFTVSKVHVEAAEAAYSTAWELGETTSNRHVVDIHDYGIDRVLFVGRPSAKAVVLMLPGGAGTLGIRRNGTLKHRNNFVVRDIPLWNRLGYTVVVPDSGKDVNLRGLRSSAEYVAALRRLISFTHQKFGKKVGVIGTSQGAIAAVGAGASDTNNSLAAVVLAEPVSILGNSGETVFTAELRSVKAPVLVIANADDRCWVAPPTMAPRIKALLTGSRRVEILETSGGRKVSKHDCGSLTPHGYYGVEASIVLEIDRWLKSLQ